MPLKIPAPVTPWARFLLLGPALLLTACPTTTPEKDTAWQQVALGDADNAVAQLNLQVEQQAVAAGVDVLVDWSDLSRDAWGRPVETVAGGHDMLLYHLADPDLPDLLASLALGTLPQSKVLLDMSCSSTTSGCYLSDFFYRDGHPIDLVSMFQPGDTTWLAILRSATNSQDLAYLAPDPMADSAVEVARLADDTSVYQLDLATPPVVEVENNPLTLLDWTGLTRDTLGTNLAAYRLDRLTLARIADGVQAEPRDLLMDLAVIAAEVWTADVSSVSSIQLQDLVGGEAGDTAFPGFSGDGRWYLTLQCSTCATPLVQFLARVAPVE